jgi:hypothetical protein
MEIVARRSAGGRTFMKTEKLFFGVRLFHPYFKPEEITGRIEEKPVTTQTAGEPFKTPKGRETSRINTQTFVVYDFSIDDNNLVEAIKTGNGFLLKNIDFINELKRTGGKCDYYITSNSRDKFTFYISPEIFNECAALGIHLNVEIYFNPETNEGQAGDAP